MGPKEHGKLFLSCKVRETKITSSSNNYKSLKHQKSNSIVMTTLIIASKSISIVASPRHHYCNLLNQFLYGVKSAHGETVIVLDHGVSVQVHKVEVKKDEVGGTMGNLSLCEGRLWAWCAYMRPLYLGVTPGKDVLIQNYYIAHNRVTHLLGNSSMHGLSLFFSNFFEP